MKKFFSKVKAVVKRGKVVVASALAACTAAVVSVCSFAAEGEVPATPAATDMETMMTSAGEQLTAQFSSLVSTIIPVILGILGSGLVIFGIIALIRLAKKVFGKVAG